MSSILRYSLSLPSGTNLVLPIEAPPSFIHSEVWFLKSLDVQGVAVTSACSGLGGRADMQDRPADWRLGHQETMGISSINLGGSILQSSNSSSAERFFDASAVQYPIVLLSHSGCLSLSMANLQASQKDS